MPFESQAQKGYLFANVPEVAARFARETSAKQMARLPKYKRKKRQTEK